MDIIRPRIAQRDRINTPYTTRSIRYRVTSISNDIGNEKQRRLQAGFVRCVHHQSDPIAIRERRPSMLIL